MGGEGITRRSRGGSKSRLLQNAINHFDLTPDPMYHHRNAFNAQKGVSARHMGST